MSIAFVCTNDPDGSPISHETSIAMVRCPRCGRYAVGGYLCDTCGHSDGHSDTDPPGQLAGHGEGRCEPTAQSDTPKETQ